MFHGNYVLYAYTFIIYYYLTILIDKYKYTYKYIYGKYKSMFLEEIRQ